MSFALPPVVQARSKRVLSLTDVVSGAPGHNRGGVVETPLLARTQGGNTGEVRRRAVVVRRNLLYSLAEVSWLPRPTACRRAVGMLTVARFCVCSIGLSFVLALALCFVLFTCVFTALELVHVNFICIVQGSLSLSILCSRLPQSHFGVSPEEYR